MLNSEQAEPLYIQLKKRSNPPLRTVPLIQEIKFLLKLSLVKHIMSAELLLGKL